MSEPQRPEIVALGGMERFACLGSECEDTCCQTWNIAIDQPHYERLSTLLPTAELDRTFALYPEAERSPHAFARIRLRVDNQHCPQLTQERLCALHQHHGEAALPDVCASYPRLLRQVGERFELYGALSCPEVVRQVLLTDDGTTLTETEASVLGRAPLVTQATPAQAPLLDELRGGLLYLLDQWHLDVGQRLALLAWLAEELADVAADAPDATLAQTIEIVGMMMDTETVDALTSELDAIAADDTAAHVLLGQSLRLRALVRADLDVVLEHYLRHGALAREDERLASTPAFTAVWHARRARVPASLVAALDQRLLRYARVLVLRDTAPDPAVLLSTLREVILRVAVLRFVVLSHPDACRDLASLDALLVQLIYQSARRLDHAAELRQAVFADTVELMPAAWDLTALIALAFGR